MCNYCLLLKMVDSHKTHAITAHFSHHAQASPSQDTKVYVVMSDMQHFFLSAFLVWTLL